MLCHHPEHEDADPRGENRRIAAIVHRGAMTMSKPMDPRQAEDKAKKKPGGQQHPNPPKKTDTNNPERNPRDQKGRGGSK